MYTHLHTVNLKLSSDVTCVYICLYTVNKAVLWSHIYVHIPTHSKYIDPYATSSRRNSWWRTIFKVGPCLEEGGDPAGLYYTDTTFRNFGPRLSTLKECISSVRDGPNCLHSRAVCLHLQMVPLQQKTWPSLQALFVLRSSSFYRIKSGMSPWRATSFPTP